MGEKEIILFIIFVNFSSRLYSQIEFECYFGYQDLAVDNIRISPLFCSKCPLK